MSGDLLAERARERQYVEDLLCNIEQAFPGIERTVDRNDFGEWENPQAEVQTVQLILGPADGAFTTVWESTMEILLAGHWYGRVVGKAEFVCTTRADPEDVAKYGQDWVPPRLDPFGDMMAEVRKLDGDAGA